MKQTLKTSERPLICFDSQETLDGFVTAFKEKYFAYYDDVKDKSLKRQDW